MSPVPDLDYESDHFSLWFVWLWEEQQYWEPDGSGKRQGASHRPPWERGSITEDLLRAGRFCFMALAECDHPSVGVGRGLVPHRLLQTQPFLCSPWGAVFTFNAGQTTKSGPHGDLGFNPFEFKPLSKAPHIARGYHWLCSLRDNGCLWKRLSEMFLGICQVGSMNCLSSINYRQGIPAPVNEYYFHFFKKRPHWNMLSNLRSLLSDPLHISLSRLLSATRYWLCSFVCCPLSYVCSLHLSKCLLCPLSHVHFLGLVKSVLSVGVSCKEERRQFASLATNCCSWTQTRPPGSAMKLLSIYLKWLPLLYHSRAQTSVALAQT